MWQQSVNNQSIEPHSLTLVRIKDCHLESSKQNYHIFPLGAIIKAIFIYDRTRTHFSGQNFSLSLSLTHRHTHTRTHTHSLFSTYTMAARTWPSLIPCPSPLYKDTHKPWDIHTLSLSHTHTLADRTWPPPSPFSSPSPFPRRLPNTMTFKNKDTHTHSLSFIHTHWRTKLYIVLQCGDFEAPAFFFCDCLYYFKQ